MEIRPAATDDVDAIAALVENAYRHYVPRIGLRPGPMDDDHAADVAAGDTFVAVDGDIAGVIVMRAFADHLLVHNVVVAPERQGEGIGRVLLDFAADTARGLGLRELRLYTHEAMTENLALYSRLGWREYERRQEHGFSRVFMRKTLSR